MHLNIPGVPERRYRKFQPVSWIPITAKNFNWHQCKANYLKFLWYPGCSRDLINLDVINDSVNCFLK